MKPNFALDLSPDNITLLHNTQTGWQPVGTTQTDSPNLPQNLSFMRQTAVQLDQRGLATMLIIPASQVLFIQVDAPGPTDAERIIQIKTALEGRTPYDLDELCFDWHHDDDQDGDQTHVAAVTWVTLKEAETFAKEYGFNPVCFVADGVQHGFPGEATFDYDGRAPSATQTEPAPTDQTPLILSQQVETPQEEHADDIAANAPADDPDHSPAIAADNDNPQLAPILSDANASLNMDHTHRTPGGFARPQWPQWLNASLIERIPPRQAGFAGLGVVICLALAMLVWPEGNDTPDTTLDATVASLAPPDETTPTIDDTALAQAPAQTESSDQPVQTPQSETSQAPEYTLVPPNETPPETLRSPKSDTLETFYAAAPDHRTAGHDAVALPIAEPNPDADRIASLPNPAPPSVVVVDGSAVTDSPGQSDTTQPPEDIQTIDAVSSTDTQDDPATELSAEQAAELERLSRFRPASRPDNLTELVERGRFAGLTLQELSQRRPATRPSSPQATPPEDAQDAVAIASSLRPIQRPENFSALVAASRARNAVAEQNRIANAAASAAASAVASNSATATVPTPSQPQIPTSASVARQATFEGALNLRRTALIGVYGSANNRRALVRLRNGRYKRVSIGDRLDGGTVAAISSDRLEYTKGSRSVILQMPES